MSWIGVGASAAAISAGTGVAGMFMGGGGGGGPELKDIRSEEQKRAQAALMQLGETGTYGDITLGEGYEGSLGSYDASGSAQSQQQLLDLYGGNALRTSQDTLTRQAQNTFDPSDPKSGYAAFSRALAKSGAEAGDVLNREAAISGNRFGTAIAGEKAGLAGDMANQRGMFLADLYNQGENRAANAAGGLQNLANTKAGISMSAAQQQAMVNQQKDLQAKDSLNEFKRQRSEELSRIDLLSAEASRNPYMGITSLPGGSGSSPFSSLASSVLGGIGTQIGNFDFGSLFGGGGGAGGGVGIGGGSGLSGLGNLSGVDTGGFGGLDNLPAIGAGL